MSKLTPKQQKFLEAYLGEANFNATAAARIAGYKGTDNTLKSIGCENLTKPDIAAALSAAWEKRGMEPSEIIGRFADIARASLEDFLTINDRGGYKIDLQKARDAGKLHCLKSLKETQFGLAIQLHSPLEALDKLARVHKLFADQNITIDMEFVQIVLAALPDEYRDSVREALLLAGDPGE